MPNTSVHFPDSVLAGLDRIARDEEVSRNSLIVAACRRALEERTGWPPTFLRNDHLSDEDLELLRQGEADFRRVLAQTRRSRRVPPF